MTKRRQRNSNDEEIRRYEVENEEDGMDEGLGKEGDEEKEKGTAPTDRCSIREPRGLGLDDGYEPSCNVPS